MILRIDDTARALSCAATPGVPRSDIDMCRKAPLV
jgi:hypothetical protein